MNSSSRDHDLTTTAKPRLKDPALMTPLERDIAGFDWAIAHGLSYRVECVDSIAGWRWDLSDGWPGRRYYQINWRRIPAKLGDCRRWAEMQWRKFWLLHVLKLRNPYEGSAHKASPQGDSGRPK